MEPTRPTTPDPNVIIRRNAKWTPQLNKQQLNPQTNQKTNYAALAHRGKSRREGVFNRRSPHHIRQRHNNRIQWYTDGRLAETTSTRLHKKTTRTNRTEGTLPQDKDYRGDDKHHMNLPSQPPLITEEHTIASQSENAPDEQPSPQTTEVDPYSNARIPSFPDDFPTSLNAIKE